jgi:hypothetical protein
MATKLHSIENLPYFPTKALLSSGSAIFKGDNMECVFKNKILKTWIDEQIKILEEIRANL